MNLGISTSRKGSLSKFHSKSSAATRGRKLDMALASGALLGVNAAKRRAPFLTGNLRRSIHVGGFEDLTPDARGIVQRGQPVPVPAGQPMQRSIYWGTDVEYARGVEFGEGNRRAKPYIRTAYNETRGAVAGAVGEALRDLIRAARVAA